MYRYWCFFLFCTYRHREVVCISIPRTVSTVIRIVPLLGYSKCRRHYSRINADEVREKTSRISTVPIGTARITILVKNTLHTLSSILRIFLTYSPLALYCHSGLDEY